MKTFCFTIDDNIRFLKEITEQQFSSIFDHPYLAMLYRLHERFGVKIQLNLFYRMDGFDLSQMSDKYVDEWDAVSNWLKLSFHSDWENVCPYENSGYSKVFGDCRAVHEQILRFASPKSLAKTTTIHYCLTTNEGLRALSDNNIHGLLGLFGSADHPRTSYGIDEDAASNIRNGQVISIAGMAFASLDVIVNAYKMEDVLPVLSGFLSRESMRIMIHEQYFYENYEAYQPDFEKKLETVFTQLRDAGYQSSFFEELI